jgi:hypothetical protein
MIGNSLAQGLISGANIQDGTVDTPDIKDSAVTAAKIASAVVTPAKMDFSAGTANGVLYLNGSKVASSGSALVFDGTNFGVGTSSPSAQIHVYKNATSAAQITLENASTSSGSYGTVQFNAGTVTSQLFSDAAGGVYAAGAVLRTTSNHPLIFGTNSAERARIDTSGTLLVGATSAAYSAAGRGIAGINGTSAAQLYLSKAGSASTAAYLYYDGTDITLANDTSGGAVKFWTQGGSERARITSAGDLLVGATSTRASAKLDIRGDVMTLGSNASYFATIDYSAATGYLSLASESGGGLLFKSGSTERVRIDTGGFLTAKKYITHHTDNGSSIAIQRAYSLPSYTYYTGSAYHNTTVRLGRFGTSGGRLRGKIMFAGDFNYAYQTAIIEFDMKVWYSETGRFCFAGKEVLGFVGGQFATDTSRYIYFNHGYLWSQDCQLIIEAEDGFEFAIAGLENYHSVTRPWRGVAADTALQYEVDYGA